MSKKSKYSQTCEEIKKKIEATTRPNGKHPVSVSNSDLNNMAQALLNSPDHTVTEYNSKTGDSVEKAPSTRYRQSLKPMLKGMGIDKNEIDKVDEFEFSKESASALMELAGTVIKDYIRVGRKYKFPITEKDESQMSFSCNDVAERTTTPNRFETVNGKTISVPTNRTTVTAKHKAIKSGNTVPHWLKKDK